ncbi:MAG: hypothetical protein KAJ40_02565 [Alphaproteobacteria bacterium]|nr:hypothetical protein [Alphaproteobacteria bacterium]
MKTACLKILSVFVLIIIVTIPALATENLPANTATDNIELEAPAKSFLVVPLPKAISIELPKNWVVLSNSQRITMGAFLESIQNKVLNEGDDIASSLPFAANYFDDNRRTIAIMNVRYYPEMDVFQEEARNFTKLDIEELDTGIKEGFYRVTEASGMKILSWDGTAKQMLHGYTTYVTEYVRQSMVGPGSFRVRMIRILDGKNSFTITVSYLESQTFLMKPIIEHIISSLKISKEPEEMPDNLSGSSETQSMMTTFYGEHWGFSILFAFLVTWGIGLTPPLLIRYALYRRPLNKWPAIGYCALLFFVNIVIFTALGSESKTHSALVLIALVSYYILKKRGKESPATINSVDKPKTKEEDTENSVKSGKEVAATITALKELRSEYDSTGIFHSLAVDGAFKQAKIIIRADKQNVVEGITNDGRDPAEIALTTLWNVSNQEVSTGHYHVYRGLLTEQGKGYLYVYNKTVDVLLDREFIDKKEAESNRKSIKENIKNTG